MLINHLIQYVYPLQDDPQDPTCPAVGSVSTLRILAFLINCYYVQDDPQDPTCLDPTYPNPNLQVLIMYPCRTILTILPVLHFDPCISPRILGVLLNRFFYIPFAGPYSGHGALYRYIVLHALDPTCPAFGSLYQPQDPILTVYDQHRQDPSGATRIQLQDINDSKICPAEGIQ